MLLIILIMIIAITIYIYIYVDTLHPHLPLTPASNASHEPTPLCTRSQERIKIPEKRGLSGLEAHFS